MMETVRTTVRLKVRIYKRQARLEAIRRTPLACMICMAMCGSGAGTGTGTTPLARRRIPWVRLRAAIAWVAAGAGILTAGACGRLIEAAIVPGSGTTGWVSGLFAPLPHGKREGRAWAGYRPPPKCPWGQALNFRPRRPVPVLNSAPSLRPLRLCAKHPGLN